jgi:hypothetical protein
MRGFENRVRKGTFGPKKEKEEKDGENFTKRSFVICNLTTYYESDRIKVDVVSIACDISERKMYRKF